METLYTRFVLFLVGCMGTRFALVYLAAILSRPNLAILGAVTLLPAAGFFYLYATGSRTTGPEVFGERIWWNDLRPLHGSLYLVFSISALRGNPQSWIVLLVDALIGLAMFMIHHWSHLRGVFFPKNKNASLESDSSSPHGRADPAS